MEKDKNFEADEDENQTDKNDDRHKHHSRTNFRRGMGFRGRKPPSRVTRKHQYTSESDLSELSSNLKDLFLSGEDSDIIIAVKDQKFPVHKAILCARSPAFGAMLNRKQTENHGVLKLDDCEPRIFSLLLLFLYSGKFPGVAPEDGLQLFLISGKYEVKGLMRHAARFVARNLSVETVGEVLSVTALQHDMPSLWAEATNYFVGNANAVLPTAKWLSFVRSQPLKANNLFIRVLSGRILLEEDRRSESDASELYLTPPEDMVPSETSSISPTDFPTNPDHKEGMATSVCYPEHKSLDLLSTNLRKLFLDYEDSDVTFKVKDCFYPAHRNILRVQSWVLSELIGRKQQLQPSSAGDCRTDDSGKIVEITDCEPADFRDFLLYLYSGKPDCITRENVFEMFEMSKVYDVQGLLELCVHFLSRNLTSELVGDVLSMATKHDEERLLASAGKFFVDNAVDVLSTTEWKKFVKTHPVEANGLFMKALERMADANRTTGPNSPQANRTGLGPWD